MTLIEKKSERKKKALINLVEKGEYSIAFALMEAERLNDEGKLLDKDYEEVAEYLETSLEPEEVEKLEEVEEPKEVEIPKEEVLVDTEENTESTAENAENSAESKEEQWMKNTFKK